MQNRTLASLLLVARLGLAQQFPPYVQFQGGGVPAPEHGISQEVNQTLQEADRAPNASHTVRLRSPGNGDWDWTLQISDVSVPGISNSTADAHVAYTTWHFSRTSEEPTPDKRDEDSPVCAYLMDINFPYNVSSQWDPDDSSCIPALGLRCASALSAVTINDNCDTDNAYFDYEDQCAGMVSGGPAMTNNVITQGLRFDASEVRNGTWAYALTAPYEGSNKTAYQAASERLRIMVLSGPDGSDAFCNRVARTVEIGAEEESDSGSDGDSDSGDGQGDGSGSGSGGGDSESDNEDDESAAALFTPHVGGLAFAATCVLAAYVL